MCVKYAKFVGALVFLCMVSNARCRQESRHFKTPFESVFKENRIDNIDNCLLKGNITCVEVIVKSKVLEFIKKKEIKVMENVAIEKLEDETSIKEEERLKNLIESRRRINFYWLNQVGDLFSNRALKVDLWDLLNLRLSKSLESPGDAELSIEVVPAVKNGIIKGKGHRTARIVVPLVIGFIFTGLGILAISVVKAVLIKAFVVSTVAALVAVFLVVKKALANSSHPSHPEIYHYKPYPIPYDIPYAHMDYAAYATPYNAYSHYQTINPTDITWSGDSGYAGYGGAELDTNAHAAVAATDEDQDGHFSNQKTTLTAVNGAAKIKRRQGDAGAYRGMIKLVKSQANRVPVLAYRLAGTGRKMN